MIRTKARQGSLDRAAIDTLTRGDHGDPFSVLGPHADGAGGVVVRTFQPHAARVWLIDAASAARRTARGPRDGSAAAHPP